MRLEGSVVIVTGASDGIGKETARQFRHAGANVTIAARRQAQLQTLSDELASLPGQTLVAPTDVCSDDQVQSMVEQTLAVFGRIDVLVNNAGLSLKASLTDGDIDNQHYLWDVNYWGYLRCLRAVVPHMRARGTGTIINISSVASRIAIPYEGTYSATKAALASLSDSLRLELSEDGIKVITIYPGLTTTALGKNTIKELELSPTSRLLRPVTAKAVGRVIVKSARRGQREAYVSIADIAGVAIKGIAPRLIDWGMCRLYLGGRKQKQLGQ